MQVVPPQTCVIFLNPNDLLIVVLAYLAKITLMYLADNFYPRQFTVHSLGITSTTLATQCNFLITTENVDSLFYFISS